MGNKKPTQVASMKISKNNNETHKKQQQQLNNLIKVLRPKVYITDSSSFKNLVQELTGNGNIVPLVSSSSPPLLVDDQINTSPVIEIEDDVTDSTGVYNLYQQSSPDFSSLASSSEVSLPNNSFTPSMEYYFSPEELSYEHGNSMENVDYTMQYRNVESWLLEIDSLDNLNYDYGLTGIVI